VGSISLALLLLSLGLWFVVTVPGSVIALVLARAARRRIEVGLTMLGAGPARAGQIIAVIGIVAGIVAGIVWVILFASGFSLEELLDDLQQELEEQRDEGGSSPDTIEA
jgi:hypothetical protein